LKYIDQRAPIYCTIFCTDGLDYGETEALDIERKEVPFNVLQDMTLS